jgi:hypothetical protein
MSRQWEAKVSEASGRTGLRRAFSWWPAATMALAALAMLYALGRSPGIGRLPNGRVSFERAGPASTPRGPESEPAGWFVHLVDISGSAKVGAGRRRRHQVIEPPADTPYDRALGLVSESVLGLRQLSEALPQRHSVIAITSASLYQKPLCDITVPKVNLFTGGDTASMMASISRCDSILRHTRWSLRTDIRGALKLAGLVLDQKPGRIRGIIVVSDLEETLRRGQEAAVPSLHGECVLLVPLITPAVARQPSLLDKRVETWRQLALEWGASRVGVRTVPAFSRGDVVRFFRDCGKEQTRK